MCSILASEESNYKHGSDKIGCVVAILSKGIYRLLSKLPKQICYCASFKWYSTPSPCSLQLNLNPVVYVWGGGGGNELPTN